MISTVHEDKDHRRQGRYALTETAHGQVWGVCDAVEGLFGEPSGGLGSNRVWLVRDDETLEPWPLEDTESVGRLRCADSLILTGLDDYEGPPEGYRGPVRVHNERQWLGSCREFARILPQERVAPPLVLRGLAQGDALRAALSKNTRRSLNLEEAALEIRDDHGELLTDRLLNARVRAWRPSSYGADLIDLELDGELFEPVPDYARTIWKRWLAGPPISFGAWAGLDTRHRWVWLDLVQERGFRRSRGDRPAGHAYELDGRHVTDVPGLYLALGEAVNGPGGYFGGCLAAVDDCLRGTFGYTAPATLLWRNAATAHEYLSHVLTPAGRPYDLFAEALDTLAEGGVRVLT
ncbi:barstar family protein [Streptomyces xylophagus]|uniref:barstar family protein n=1 Tax=Streptomyces xylophagus TaxID=285514 RepID=UPI0005BC3D16|nr:barstar family protein [Streptomyces xylophagus]